MDLTTSLKRVSTIARQTTAICLRRLLSLIQCKICQLLQPPKLSISSNWFEVFVLEFGATNKIIKFRLQPERHILGPLFLFDCSTSHVDIMKLTKPISLHNCGQSYKAPTIVNYDSRVVPDWKIPHITTLES